MTQAEPNVEGVDVSKGLSNISDASAKPASVRRFERAFGPVMAGVILDCVDFAAMGPLAFIIGIIVGFWIFSIYRLPLQHRIIGALLAGAYCMMPFTRFLPLATLIGAWTRFRESK